MKFWYGALALLAMGCQGKVETTCDLMCRELVQNCGIDAYPTLDSCRQGCNYAEEQGADVESQKQCVDDAACDPFLIVECENAYGQPD